MAMPKKTAPIQVQPKKRQPVPPKKKVTPQERIKLPPIKIDMSFKKEYENLKELTERIEKETARLRQDNNGLLKTLIDSSRKEAVNPCPKCQILDILSTLSEAQVNSVLRDVHIEVDYSRTAKMNMLEDKLKKVAYKRDAFREAVNSHETYK